MDNINPLLYKKATKVYLSNDSDIELNGRKYSSLKDIDDCFAASEVSNCNDKNKELIDLLVPNSNYDSFDAEEIFDMVRNIKDPEYSYTLEELKVVEIGNIYIDDALPSVRLYFSPTVPHCSQATLIGLMIFVKLYQSLPQYFKIDVQILNGTHNNEEAINKQLLDKERVAAALENPLLLDLINEGINSGSVVHDLISPVW